MRQIGRQTNRQRQTDIKRIGRECQGETNKQEKQTDRQTDIGFVASMHNDHQGHFKVQKDFN